MTAMMYFLADGFILKIVQNMIKKKPVNEACKILNKLWKG